MKEILDVIHNTIYQFFDVCGDDEEVPISDKDKLLLEVNKAICNNLKALEQEPCEDAISREATLKPYNGLNDEDTISVWLIRKNIEQQPSVAPQEPKTGQFAKWVANEIFDDNWEYNKDAFAELACRKLAKLGIVRAKGDEWELVKPQESEEVNG